MSMRHPAVVADPSEILGRNFRDLVDERALRPDPAQVDWFRGFAHAADPPADAVVEEIATGDTAAARAALQHAFDHGLTTDDEAPEAVRAFFERTARPPYWLDPEQVRAGQRALARVGVLGLMSLGSLALMGGYLSKRSIKPLMRTGELDAMAPRRLVETASWWLEVTTPGSLEPGGAGAASTLRVRITHAHVRRWMHRSPDWDYAAWDSPVNQIQMAGTHLLFSTACMGGLQRLGVHYDDRERAAIMHLWRYVGWLMGVDEALLPATEQDGWRLFWLMAATELDPDEDSVTLAQALARGSGLAAADAPDVVVRAGLAFNAGMSRYLLGEQACDALGLPRSRAASMAVKALTRGVSFAETGRRLVPGATAVVGLVGRETRRRFIENAAAQVQADRSYARDHTDRTPRPRSQTQERLRGA
jgi:hypothetical protein